MWNSPWDYQPDKDKLPNNITSFIIIAAVLAAIYLSLVLV